LKIREKAKQRNVLLPLLSLFLSLSLIFCVKKTRIEDEVRDLTENERERS